MKSFIAPHEPQEVLLSAEDAWEDYLSLKRALRKQDAGEPSLQLVPVEVRPDIWSLVQMLIAAGVCHDEGEVIARAVQSFFVAVFPQEEKRNQVLQEAAANP